MVHGKNSIPYRIDRRLIGLAGPDYDATISSAEGSLTMPLGTFPRGLNVPPPAKDSTPVDYAEALGETYLSFSKHNHRKSVGHYLTPATFFRPLRNPCRPQGLGYRSHCPPHPPAPPVRTR